MEVELRHMQAFVALAEERHFGRAAERLQIAQPPLSRQIRELERELGTELIDRSTRPVRLTVAGEVFLERARIAVREAHRASERARWGSRGQLAWLSVAGLPWGFNGILLAAARAFGVRRPGVRLELSTTTPALQADSLRDGALDVVFAQWANDTGGLQLEPLLEEPRIALVPGEHRLARGPALSLEELARAPFVAMCPVCYPNLARDHATLFYDRGLRPEPAQQACGPLEQLGMVAAGLGLGLALASLRPLRPRGVSFVPLERDTPPSSLHLLWRRGDAREHLRAFLDTAREVARFMTVTA
jgi:DNA-binding transcriptional LysR family regulator